MASVTTTLQGNKITKTYASLVDARSAASEGVRDGIVFTAAELGAETSGTLVEVHYPPCKLTELTVLS